MDHKMRTVLLAAVLACLLLLGAGSSRATAPQSPTYALTAWSADCGGTAWAESGPYALGATLGQPDATQPLTSGRYGLVGGLWGAPGGVPQIEVSAPPLEATLCPGAQSALEMGLCNQGAAALTWSLAEEARIQGTGLDWLSESPESGTLAPSECVSVTVTFDAGTLAPGTYLGALLVNSDDPANPQVSLDAGLAVLEPLHDAAFDWTPLTPLPGEEVRFEATAQGTAPISYTWDLGDGAAGSGEVVTHTYAAAGDYSVVLTAANACAQEAVTHTLAVVVGHLVVSGPPLEAEVCPNGTAGVDLNACNQGTGPLTWSLAEDPEMPWLSEAPGGGMLAAGECVSVSVGFDSSGLAPGLYTGNLLVNSNDPDNPLIPLPASLAVDDPVHDGGFDWTPPTPVYGQLVTFQATAQGTQPIAFTWAFGDGSTGSGPTVDHTFPSHGDYTVTLTATNACGQQVVPRTVTVAPIGTMHVQWIKLRYLDRGLGRYLLRGQVRILDAAGHPAAGAVVSVEWTPPSGAAKAQSRPTNANGIAAFKLQTMQTGLWKLCVTDVGKAGWVYDSGQNRETCKDLTVP